MAIERNNKVLDGAGLLVYTGLIKNELDGITTTLNDNIANAISTLVGNASTHGNTLELLEDRIEENENDISNIEGAIGELADAIDGITTTTIPGIIEDINGITTDIEGIHSDIDGITTSISGIEEDIDGITTNISEMQEDIDGITTSISGIEENIDGITNTISGIEEDIDGITTNIGELEDAIDGITSTIANLGNDYKALQEATTITLNAGEYIVGLAQDEQGVITATTAVLPAPSTASDSAEGLVQLANGATNAIVYSADQVDAIASSIGTTIDGLTTTLTTTYKALQNAVTITVPVGYAVSKIEQNENGVVSAETTALPLASASTPGMVTMASGATTNEVYSTDQVLGLIAGVSGDVSGLTNTFKQLQVAVTNPTASGSTNSFISSIAQDEQGVITATAATLPTASSTVFGVVRMSAGSTTAVVYDKEEVDSAINSAVASFITTEIASASTTGLPDVADPEENKVYLVPNGTGSTPNYYIEYMYVNDGWEVVGNTELAIESLSNQDVSDIWDAVMNPTP